VIGGSSFKKSSHRSLRCAFSGRMACNCAKKWAQPLA